MWVKWIIFSQSNIDSKLKLIGLTSKPERNEYNDSNKSRKNMPDYQNMKIVMYNVTYYYRV